MPQFIKGLALSSEFYINVVGPCLREGFPRLVFSIGRLGCGSDVLGFDTAMSTDHDWGPQVDVFVSEADHMTFADAVRAYLNSHLPRRFRGYPVAFTAPDIFDNGTQCMDYDGTEGPFRHRVIIHTVRSFLLRHLGTDLKAPLSSLDWLSFAEQRLLEVTAGEVFYDGLGELGRVRKSLEYYPRDVWLFRLAAQWHRLGQEEPFVGRCGVVDDDLGSRVIAARLVRDLMRLCFLMERRYAPYGKWLGTAFKQLTCYGEMEPLLQRAIRANTWEERERAIGEASSLAGEMHNALGITPSVDTGLRPFHQRPFQVLDSDRFSRALLSEIGDRWLRTRSLVGGVDQHCDCTDVLSKPVLTRSLNALYREN